MAPGKRWVSRSVTVDANSPMQLRIYNRTEDGRAGGPPTLRTLAMQVTGAQVDITHTDWIDDAQFTRTYSLYAGQPIRRVRCQSNLTSWVAKLHSGSTAAQVNVAALEGHSDVFGDYYATTGAIAATRSANQVNGAGVLLSASITAKALTTSCYPMFLDLASSSAPVSGTTVPIAGSVGAILASAGVQDTWVDQLMSASIVYVNGLWFALSTTPDVWTDPGTGNTAVGSYTIGV